MKGIGVDKCILRREMFEWKTEQRDILRLSQQRIIFNPGLYVCLGAQPVVFETVRDPHLTPVCKVCSTACSHSAVCSSAVI